jgi:hypothetical protein
MSTDRIPSTRPVRPEDAGDAAPERPLRPGESPLPSPGVDRRTGRALPVPDGEWAGRMAALGRELDEIDAEDDTPEEVYEQIFRDIDEERRRQGRPPAFEGYDRC